MKLQIKLSDWDRGLRDREIKDLEDLEGAYESPKLLCEYGMCCLGFFALSCGYNRNEIYDVAVLSDLPDVRQNIPASFVNSFERKAFYDSKISMKLAKVNDAPLVGTPGVEYLPRINDLDSLDGMLQEAYCKISSEELRMSLIKELFKQGGVEVEFVP
jgi:hypothetical protein